MTDFWREGPPQGSADAWSSPQPFSPPPGAPAPNPPQAMYAPSPASVWDPPQNTWSKQPAKKRKAWPWVLGIVGGLVVLGGAGAAMAFGVDALLHSDQNDNYTGSPIAAGDAPTRGDQVFISHSGSVAFDIRAEWDDLTKPGTGYSTVGPSPDGARLIAEYFTVDSADPDVPLPTLVMVFEGEPADHVGPIDLPTNHKRFVAADVDGYGGSGSTVTTTEARPLTTANGLDGLVTSVSIEYKRIRFSIYKYTFVRSQRVVHVEIIAYTETFDEATAALVTDSLRIDE